MLREWVDKSSSGPSRKSFDCRNLFLLIGFLMMRFSQGLQVFLMSSLFSLTIMGFMPYQPTVHAQTIYVGIFYLRASSIKTYPMFLRCTILVHVVKRYGRPGPSHSIFASVLVTRSSLESASFLLVTKSRFLLSSIFFDKR